MGMFDPSSNDSALTVCKTEIENEDNDILQVLAGLNTCFPSVSFE